MDEYDDDDVVGFGSSMKAGPRQLPPPIPDTEDDESVLKHMLGKHAIEVVGHLTPRIEKDPVRVLGVLESYAASTRTLMADLDHGPSPRKQRGMGGYGIGNNNLGPPELSGFLDGLTSMVQDQTSAQKAGKTEGAIRSLSDAMRALPEDESGLRDRLRAQIDRKLAQLEAEAGEADLLGPPIEPATEPTILIDQGVLPDTGVAS